MAGEGDGHRRVVPQDVAADLVLREEGIEETPPRPGCRLAVVPRGQVRHEQADALTFRLCEIRRPRIVQRLLDKEDPPLLGAAPHQVLRPLVDPIPSQMGQTYNVVRLFDKYIRHDLPLTPLPVSCTGRGSVLRLRAKLSAIWQERCHLLTLRVRTGIYSVSCIRPIPWRMVDER